MKIVKYDIHIKELKSKTLLRARLENGFKSRTCRQRPRDPRKEELLTMLDKERWQKAIRSGSIRILGKRKVAMSL